MLKYYINNLTHLENITILNIENIYDKIKYQLNNISIDIIT